LENSVGPPKQDVEGWKATPPGDGKKRRINHEPHERHEFVV
jgi:hypothetical protein